MRVQVTGGNGSTTGRVGAGIFSTRPGDDSSGELRTGNSMFVNTTYVSADVEDIFHANLGDIRYSAAFGSVANWSKYLSKIYTYTILEYLGV